MAALANTLPTFADLAKQVDGGWANIQPVIELLSKRHGLISVLGFEEANHAIAHRTTVRTGLPSAAYRMFNLGQDPSDGSYAQVTFPVAKIGSFAEIDAELIKVAPNRERFVANKVAGHVEAVYAKLSNEMFYGTAATAEGIIGLSAMYSSTTAENAQNLLDAGGTDNADNASIWLLNLGQTVKGLYPRGTMAGIEREAIGYETSESLGGSGKRGRVWRENIQVGAGLAVEDWRDAGRIASIDVSALNAEVNDADLLRLSRKLKHRMLAQTMGRKVWVMHPFVWEAIQHQRDDKQVAGGGVSRETIDGVEVDTLHGYEVVIDDNLLLTEAPV